MKMEAEVYICANVAFFFAYITLIFLWFIKQNW